MADVRVQELEERLGAGERLEDLEPEEGALVLRARLEAGELSPEALELAAHCELAAACEALGQMAEDLSLAAWVEGLERWGREPQVRVLSALARLALQTFDAGRGPSEDPGDEDEEEAGMGDAVADERALSDLEDTQGLIEQWIEEPRPELVEQARAHLDAAVDQGAFYNIAYTSLAALVGAMEDDGAVGSDGLTQAADLVAGVLDQERVLRLLRRDVLNRALQPQVPVERAEARPYSPQERFQVGEALAHPKFGEGEVVRVAGRQVEVAFADGSKRKLVHAPR